jgi:hypothetical protein
LKGLVESHPGLHAKSWSYVGLLQMNASAAVQTTEVLPQENIYRSTLVDVHVLMAEYWWI